MYKIISSGNFSTNSIIFIVCNNYTEYYYTEYYYKYKLAKCIYIYICIYWVVEAGDETNSWDNSKFDKFDKLGNLKQPNEQLFVGVDVEVHDDAARDAKPCCL